MSLLLRVRGFYLSNKQEKDSHKIARIAGHVETQTMQTVQTECYFFLLVP